MAIEERRRALAILRQVEVSGPRARFDHASKVFLEVHTTRPGLCADDSSNRNTRRRHDRQVATKIREVQKGACSAGELVNRDPAPHLLDLAEAVTALEKRRAAVRHFLADQRQRQRTLVVNAFTWDLRDFLILYTTLRGSELHRTIAEILAVLGLAGSREPNSVRRRLQRTEDLRHPVRRAIAEETMRSFIRWLELEAERRLAEADADAAAPIARCSDSVH